MLSPLLSYAIWVFENAYPTGCRGANMDVRMSDYKEDISCTSLIFSEIPITNV
jgi:hypothetical protein